MTCGCCARRVPQANLYMRATASPSATETNITGAHHRCTDSYDVKDVSVSTDGTMVLFAMRGPLTANMQRLRSADLGHLAVHDRERHARSA